MRKPKISVLLADIKADLQMYDDPAQVEGQRQEFVDFYNKFYGCDDTLDDTLTVDNIDWKN